MLVTQITNTANNLKLGIKYYLANKPSDVNIHNTNLRCSSIIFNRYNVRVTTLQLHRVLISP